MSTQQLADKGGQMEEVLREYFLELGYFVVRGAKYQFETCDITDIDLWLYQRTSIFSRERFNVDVKSKRSPQAMERILWAKGLQTSLGLNGALVATTDTRHDVRQFGDANSVVILDGLMLSKLKTRYKNSSKRLSEEEIKNLIRGDRDAEDWWERIEFSKSRLLSQLDFDGCNSHLADSKYFAEKILTVPHRKEIVCRFFYLSVSLALLTVDFLLREFAFLERQPQADALNNGFRYGSLGKHGAEKIFSTAAKIASAYVGGTSIRPNDLVRQLHGESQKLPVEILTEYLLKINQAKSLFEFAKSLEILAFSRAFANPAMLTTENRSLISALLDFYGMDRKKFFDAFVVESSQTTAVSSAQTIPAATSKTILELPLSNPDKTN